MLDPTEYSITFSVICPFSTDNYLNDAVISVLQQSYGNFELILVGDGIANLRLDQIIKRFADPRIKSFGVPRCQNPALLRNYGISVATGRYICFIDSDDVWLSNKLEIQLNYLKDNNSVAILSTAYIRCKENLRPISIRSQSKKLYVYSDIIYRNDIATSTVVYDSLKLPDLSFPLIKRRQDFALWLMLLRQKCVFHNITTPLVKYRVHSSSNTANKLSSMRYNWVVLRHYEEISIIGSVFFILIHAWNGFFLRVYEKISRSESH